MSKTKIVKAECSSCRGTGLYAGFTEGQGGARVCITCGGTGCEKIRYKPFMRRIRRRQANGAKLVKVFLDGAIWTKDDERSERKIISPQEFYKKGAAQHD